MYSCSTWLYSIFNYFIWNSKIEKVLSEPMAICSDYLVSGLYGVTDDALSVSSTFPLGIRYKYSKEYSRLTQCASWSSGTSDVNQYIQVQFSLDTTIHAILLQGRCDYPQWVKTYFVQYSMNATTWFTVTSPDGTPRLFNGSVDQHTIVKALIDPPFTAKFVRINPQSWYSHISLRFDLSGCQVTEYTDNKARFYKVPATDVGNMDKYSAFTTNMASFPKCSILCFRHASCVCFRHQNNLCQGYNRTIAVSLKPKSFQEDDKLFFVKLDDREQLGYKAAETNSLFYKIIEVAKNNSASRTTCTQQHSQLIKIRDSESIAILLNVIEGNLLLQRDIRFYVSGKYESQQWMLNDGELMDIPLQSSLNHTTGQCVMLTQTGLTSVECAERLFFICGN